MLTEALEGGLVVPVTWVKRTLCDIVQAREAHEVCMEALEGEAWRGMEGEQGRRGAGVGGATVPALILYIIPTLRVGVFVSFCLLAICHRIKHAPLPAQYRLLLHTLPPIFNTSFNCTYPPPPCPPTQKPPWRNSGAASRGLTQEWAQLWKDMSRDVIEIAGEQIDPSVGVPQGERGASAAGRGGGAGAGGGGAGGAGDPDHVLAPLAKEIARVGIGGGLLGLSEVQCFLAARWVGCWFWLGEGGGGAIDGLFG